jgi:hypothetical protein
MADNEKSKSFWSRPEGKPGMVVLAGLIGVGGYFLYKALPAIIELMQNTLTAIGLGVAIFAILAVLMNDRFRSTVWYLYKGLMRWFTGMAIELNPIAILESYVEDIEKKIDKMDVQLQELRGQIGKLKDKISKKTEEYNLEMRRASKAKEMGKPREEITLYSRQAGRLEEYIKKLTVLFNKMEVLFKVLDKMRYYSDIMVKDTKMTVEIKKEEREMITKGYSVMKGALSIINGNDDKKVIFDQAMEFVVDDIGFKVGEMDRMLEVSSEFISSVDLDNAIYEDRGMKMLEEFEQKGMDVIFGQKSLTATNDLYNNLNSLNATAPKPVKIAADNNNSKDNKKYF